MLSKGEIEQVSSRLSAHAHNERKKYNRVWKEQGYRHRSPAESEGIPTFLEHLVCGYITKGQSVLDVGCGTGRAGMSLKDRYNKVTMVDISGECLDPYVKSILSEDFQFVQCAAWDIPFHVKHHDWLFCCDLMEHLPPDAVDHALAALSVTITRGGMFQIYTEPHKYDKMNNMDLHLTVEPAEWWVHKVSEYFKVRHAEHNSKRVTIIIGASNHGS